MVEDLAAVVAVEAAAVVRMLLGQAVVVYAPAVGIKCRIKPANHVIRPSARNVARRWSASRNERSFL